jgi:hypothetical protein
MSHLNLFKISRVFTFSAFIASFLLSQGCKNSENLDQTESDILGKAINGEWTVKLRDGRTIKTSEYSLDAESSKVIQGLIDDELKDYVPLFKSQVANNDQLSVPEGFAVYMYTMTFYLDFKTYLEAKPNQFYSVQINDSQMAALFLGVISAVNKLPKFKGTTYFGAILPEQETLESIKPGKTFINSNFTSMSQVLSVAEAFSLKDQPITTPGTASFVFELQNGTSGVDIIKFSLNRKESEVLFSPKRPFNVKSIKKIRNLVSEGDGKLPAVYKVILEEK